jgi:hypothetical protein
MRGGSTKYFAAKPRSATAMKESDRESQLSRRESVWNDFSNIIALSSSAWDDFDSHYLQG